MNERSHDGNLNEATDGMEKICLKLLAIWRRHLFKFAHNTDLREFVYFEDLIDALKLMNNAYQIWLIIENKQNICSNTNNTV
jgi:hypothetical protein